MQERIEDGFRVLHGAREVRLTDALRRIRDRLYVFTSNQDAVLSYLVPLAGTADREFCGACAAGLAGFHLPDDSMEEAAALYEKVVNITWDPAFAKIGHDGGHAGAVNPRFIREYVAPLLLRPNGQAGAEPSLSPPDIERP